MLRAFTLGEVQSCCEANRTARHGFVDSRVICVARYFVPVKHPACDSRMRIGLNLPVMIQRSIVRGKIGSVKTKRSERRLELAPNVLELLKEPRGQSSFRDTRDWLFISHFSCSRKSWSYTTVLTKHEASC